MGSKKNSKKHDKLRRQNGWSREAENFDRLSRPILSSEYLDKFKLNIGQKLRQCKVMKENREYLAKGGS